MDSEREMPSEPPKCISLPQRQDVLRGLAPGHFWVQLAVLCGSPVITNVAVPLGGAAQVPSLYFLHLVTTRLWPPPVGMLWRGDLNWHPGRRLPSEGPLNLSQGTFILNTWSVGTMFHFLFELLYQYINRVDH